MADFNVECAECGNDLQADFAQKTSYPKTIYLHVGPCEKCMDAARDKGYEDGKEESK